MRKTLLTIVITILAALACSGNVLAAPDQYVGDTAIYGGAPTVLQPNVLIIVDDSGSMSGTVAGGTYAPATTYSVTNNCSGNCTTNAVYRTTNGGSSGTFLNASINNITTSCNGVNPRNLLLTTGMYNGRRLNSDGTCRTSGSATYVLGNFINWYHSTTGFRTKIDIARDVVNNLLTSTSGVKFGLMRFHYPTSDYSNPSGAEGSEFLQVSVSGSNYQTTVKNMDAIHTGTTTNRDALIAAVNTLTDRGYTPLGESLNEALRSFKGGQTAYGNTVGVSGGYYTSPIEWGCQKNYIIFVTDGMDTASDNANLDFIQTTYGRYDGGNCTYSTCANNRSHSLPGVAKYLYEQDLRSDITGTQNVTTYTIGFGLGGADQEAIDLLQLAADSNHGRGQYFLAGNEAQLSAALTSVMSDIFAVSTSFVAPVVPVSPENRVYSGSRVYMGFFKPESTKFWSGNLKKFGLDDNNNILDANGGYASYVDNDNNRIDDRDSAVLPSTAMNGSFRASSVSYWGLTADSGDVESGGVGEILRSRVAARNLYTYKGASSDLTAASNAFTTSIISPTDLGFASGDTAARDNLINFLNGIDSYDEDLDGDTTEKRSWILGDVLHSKPQIVVYNTYTVATDETYCGNNKTMIYAGANDGMLHAFKDCDGSEAWAFIPPDLLTVLQYLGPTGGNHTYFVDFSPSVYIYNKLKNGIIDPATDKVILLFGLRRGGGIDTSPAKGYFYAVDVTDPLIPKFLWKKSSADTGFSEIGETWSEPAVGKIKDGANGTIAVFIGAGYDNCNEDARFGNTQSFPGSCVSPPTGDNGSNTSAGSSSQLNPTGRGIYIINLATLDSSGVPTLTVNGPLIKSFASADGIVFPLASRLKLMDRNFDNYIDTLYVGDTGGSLWRFNITAPSTSTAAWTVNKIFSSNSGYTNGEPDASKGRKIFFEPSVFIQEDGTVRLYFGSGDREHPLNTAVTDRLYGLIDRGQITVDAIAENNMGDVTEDTLQTSTSQTTVSNILSSLTSSTSYGWYIRLDQNSGEKALAPALIFSGFAIYTTYSPNTDASTDPCQTGNLGTARVYVVDYRTGEAVVNFDTTNDTTAPNKRAEGLGGGTLLRSDRVKILGSGIPSGGVMVTSKTGKPTLMIGVGGSIATLNPVSSITSLPLYWRQKTER